jgi:hypothetical protein
VRIPEGTDDIEPDVEAHKRDLIEPAATLFAVQRIHGDKVREQTMKAYGRLIDAHLLLMGVLGSALLRINGKIIPITPTSEERDALFASFIIGIDTCENAIAEGRYLQGLALLRQEMEILAQLKAVRAGKRNEKRSPNIGVLEKSLARMYDELSAAAHVSRHDLVRPATAWDVSGDDLPGPTSGTRQFPVFDETLARRSFALHLMLTHWFIAEMAIDLLERHDGDGFTNRETEAATLAELLMHAEGMVTIDEANFP